MISADPTLQENYIGPVGNREAYENYQAYIAELRDSGASFIAGGGALMAAWWLLALGFGVTVAVCAIVLLARDIRKRDCRHSRLYRTGAGSCRGPDHSSGCCAPR